jgi:excisionase family DNA binding protein
MGGEVRNVEIKEYMTTREAAHYLNLSVTALARKAKRGELGAFKQGRGYLFPRSEIERYAQAVEGKALTDPTRGKDL